VVTELKTKFPLLAIKLTEKIATHVRDDLKKNAKRKIS